MIESSARGDEYDGVIFSQLVWFLKNYRFTCYNMEIARPQLFMFLFQNLIDLAGSESSKTETTGLRRKEGSYINKSLLTLGTVGANFNSFFRSTVRREEKKVLHSINVECDSIISYLSYLLIIDPLPSCSFQILFFWFDRFPGLFSFEQRAFFLVMWPHIRLYIFFKRK